MKHACLLALFLSACGARQEAPAFRDVSVILPEDTVQLPDGANADLVRAACTGCHSAEMMLTQPRLDAKAWTATVEKMVKVYKAPIDPQDMPAIVEYLDATNARVAH